MQVFSKQLSGLGNQLFQYAAGVYFAARYKAMLTVLQEPSIGTLSHGKYPRPFLLSHFQITEPTRMLSRIDALMLSQGGRRAAVSGPLKWAGRIAVRHESAAQRHHFVDDLQIPAGTRRLYLSGYWQAHGYADAVAPHLRQHLQVRTPAAGNNLRVLEQIAAATTSVSLHVRRGDYTLAAEGNIALPMEYYRRAVDHVCAHHADATFFVFSDDLDYARANLPGGVRYVFVEGNDDFNSHEDLRLMSACRHHIIANSSFSWWGAWLNPRTDKVVVAPRHWHLTAESAYPDLLPPQWHAIDSLR